MLVALVLLALETVLMVALRRSAAIRYWVDMVAVVPRLLLAVKAAELVAALERRHKAILGIPNRPVTLAVLVAVMAEALAMDQLAAAQAA